MSSLFQSLMYEHKSSAFSCRRLSLRDQMSRCKESPMQPSVGTSTCYLHTAIRIDKSQSILTQIQHSSERDMVCHIFSSSSSTTCLHVGHMSLGWSWTPSRGPNQSEALTSCKKMQMVIASKSPILVLHIKDVNATPFSRLQVIGNHPVRDTCDYIPIGSLPCVSWNTRGLLCSTASSQRPREQKHIFTSHD